MKYQFQVTVLALYLFAGTFAAFARQQCPLTPVPKVYKQLDGNIEIKTPDTAIVIGSKADQVDQYAAQRLQVLIEKRFGATLTIINEDQAAKAGHAIVLGQIETNKIVADLCARNKIELGEKSPGFDGFIIETIKDNGRDIILIGGSNARGVTYGMSAFFEMLDKKNDAIICPAVSIRDWPTILYRGRNCSKEMNQAVYDEYVRSRINNIDVHDLYGTEHVGWNIKTDKVNNVLAEAHKRGIMVYGTVTCAVEPNEFGKVVEDYEKLLAMGVDGLWLSFDDKGEGVQTDKLVAGVLDLAKKHNLSGHQIMVTPATGSYQFINTQWNKKMAKVPGLNTATWFFTRVPCQCDLQQAKDIGLTETLPAWWHNWPRAQSGLLNGAYGVSMYDKQPYFEIMPLETGWGMPGDAVLKQIDKYSDTVVICAAGPDEYVQPVLGFWAWNPASYDFNATRIAIYTEVYGRDLAARAMKFDDDFIVFKNFFTHAKYKGVTPDVWPPRLKDIKDRPAALKTIAEMAAIYDELKTVSPKTSMVQQNRLEEQYLDRMADVVAYGKKYAELEFPEYSLPNFAQQMKQLVQKNPEAAQAKIDSVKPVVVAQVKAISAALTNVKNVEEYVAYWNEQLSVDYWKSQVRHEQARKKKDTQNRAELSEAFHSVVNGNYDDLLGAQANPPKAKVLAVVSPEQIVAGKMSEAGKGWGAGLYKSAKYEAAAMGFGGDKVCKKGNDAEIKIPITLPNFKGRIKAQIFIAHYSKGQTDKDRQARFTVITSGRSWIWMQDTGNTMQGNEWFTLDITPSHQPAMKPGDVLDLSVMVTNLRDTQFDNVVLFGPIRIIEEE